MKKFNYYLILAICFLLPTYLVRFEIFGIPTTLLELMIYLSFVITIILKINKSLQATSYKLQATKIWLPIGLFLLAGVIGILVSPDKRTALGQFKGFMLDPVLFFWVVISNIRTKKEIDTILRWFIYSGIYVSIFAIYQKLTGQVAHDGRIVGLFGYSPNYLAFYMTPLAILTLFIPCKNPKNTLLKIGRFLLVALFLYVIYLTGSRAGLIAFFGGAIGAIVLKYIVNLKYSKFIKTAIIIALIVIVGFLGYGLLKPDFSLSPDEGGRITSSNNVRWQIWDTTIMQIIPENNNWLLGLGLGNYQPYFTELTSDWVNYPEYISPWALTAHNLFLHTLLNIGILGLVSFIWLLYIFFKNVDIKNAISYGVFASMLAILVQGLIDTPYWKNDLSVMFFIFLGVVMLVKGSYEKNSKIRV